MLTLAHVIEALTGQAGIGGGQVITDAAVDSRLVIPGGLFVALPGGRADGHEFIPQAFERGAVAALVDRDLGPDLTVVDLRPGAGGLPAALPAAPFCLRVEHALESLQRVAGHWRSQLDLRVIGVTGSVGKSTTKELTAEVLDSRYNTVRNPGNLNNEIGLPLTLLRLTEAHERAVLEMGFYVPGEIALLCRLARPSVGVVTNISQVHLERAGTLEAIVAGKGELVESLPPAPEGVAVLNLDEPLVMGLAQRTRARVFTYGLSEQADLRADQIEGLGLEGVRFVLHYQGEAVHVRVPLLGRHSAHTALRAAAVGLVEGLTWEEIVGGLQASQSQLRLVAVQGPGGSLLLDDTYNAAPASVTAALNLLSELDGRRVAVLGDMLELGTYEERGHRMVGARAAEVADELVAVGPRAHWIADEARRSGMSELKVTEFPDSQAAVAHLRQRVGHGDVVLVKGSRGMHMDHIVSALEQTS